MDINCFERSSRSVWLETCRRIQLMESRFFLIIKTKLKVECVYINRTQAEDNTWRNLWLLVAYSPGGGW